MPIAAVVAERTEELREICRAHGVKRLDLFGSAARGDFDPERSDLDFLVTFHEGVRKPWAGQYFELQEALEGLFGRSVDLISDRAIDNPYFRRSVERSRTPLYEESVADAGERGGAVGVVEIPAASEGMTGRGSGYDGGAAGTTGEAGRLEEERGGAQTDFAENSTERDARAYLFNILRAAGYVAEFTDGIVFEDYDGDALVRSATERQLGILGQAMVDLAKHFPQVTERISDYPQIVAFRNILIHEYGRVDNGVVWEKIHKFLPHLAGEAQALIDDLSAGGE